MLHFSRRQFIQGSLASAITVGIQHLARSAEGEATSPAKSPNSIRNPRIPKVAGPFVNIYKPQADVYTLPTVKTPDRNHCFVQGTTYPDWRTNDHTFIKDDKNRWHCFGITPALGLR